MFLNVLNAALLIYVRCGYMGLFYCGTQWENGVVHVTGLSRDKFTMRNVHGYVKKEKETAGNI